MNLKQVHHLREVLVRDWKGNTVSSMEYSFDNAAYLEPHFTEVPFDYQERARELYLNYGGRWNEEVKTGTTVVIPNR